MANYHLLVVSHHGLESDTEQPMYSVVYNTGWTMQRIMGSWGWSNVNLYFRVLFIYGYYIQFEASYLLNTKDGSISPGDYGIPIQVFGVN